jgi:signal transduction histidine kinase
MRHPIRLPLRLKVLAALLLLVTAVVSVITYAMANLFHEDKRTYITDVVSVMTMSTAEQARSLLAGYQERLQAYARILGHPSIPDKDKIDLLNGLFSDFPELIAVGILDGGELKSAAYNKEALEDAGLTGDDFATLWKSENLSADKLTHGVPFIENSTLKEALPMLTMALYAAPTRAGPCGTDAGRRRRDSSSGVDRSHATVEIVRAQHHRQGGHAPRLVARERRRRKAQSHERERSRDDTRSVDHDVERHAGVQPAGHRHDRRRGADQLRGRDRHRGDSQGSRVLDRAAALGTPARGGARAARPFGIDQHGLGAPHDASARAPGPSDQEHRQGKFDTRVAIASHDEIGALATSFNEMATELKARDEALSDAQAALVQSEKLAAFGQLGAGIAHEVKNPLAGILGCAQLALRKATPGGPIHDNLKLIEKETKRCKVIVENLLKFARQEKAAFDNIRVNAAIDDAIAIISHQLSLQKVTLEKQLGQDLPIVVGNANQLQQVVINLLMNAQQAVGGSGTVSVTSRLIRDNRVEIRVQDSGPGVPPELRKKIFEPFFTTKPNGTGTGLGLSVSFGIIKDHGGEIDLESEPGKGATFIVRLPGKPLRSAAPAVAVGAGVA